MAQLSHFTENSDYNHKIRLILKTPQDSQSFAGGLAKSVTTYRKLSYFLLILGLISLISLPLRAHAGFFSIFAELMASTDKSVTIQDDSINSQNMPILKASLAPNPEYGKGGGDITIVGDALMAESGPLGTIGNIEEKAPSHQISIYTVHEGDTLSQIAKMYGVSTNTIIWANDLKGKTVKEGQTLVILPISGVMHTVKAGDTLKSIALKYKADMNEIAQFNDISVSAKLAVGDTLTVPDAEIVVPTPVKIVPKGNAPTSPIRGVSNVAYEDYYMKPVDGKKTQGLHGYNGVDLGAPVGTPIYAAAAGDVIISKMGGYNGGYGNYVVISHGNGSQTLYAHMKETIVASGERVYRGQVIGYVGLTGKTTGPHVHFEVRGARNPFQ